jgi:hypothetical protein
MGKENFVMAWVPSQGWLLQQQQQHDDASTRGPQQRPTAPTGPSNIPIRYFAWLDALCLLNLPYFTHPALHFLQLVLWLNFFLRGCVRVVG